MISVFYASFSIIITAVLSLALGFWFGFRVSQKTMRTLDALLQRDEYKNTAGAMWFGNELWKKLEDGVTIEEVRAWCEHMSDELTNRFSDPEGTGKAFVEEWKAQDEEAPAESQKEGAT